MTDDIYLALQKRLSELLLTKFFRASIDLRYVPKAWTDTKVVFIPKTGRNRHILVKDYKIY